MLNISNCGVKTAGRRIFQLRKFQNWVGSVNAEKLDVILYPDANVSSLRVTNYVKFTLAVYTVYIVEVKF